MIKLRRPQSHRVAFVVFDGMTALDLVGPMETFALAGNGVNSYEIVTVGIRRQFVVAESGLQLKPNFSLAECPVFDTLIVPGGEGLRRPAINAAVSAWIVDRARSTRRIASVCTGIFGLAPTGLLDGRKVATHWRFSGEVARRFPALHVLPDAIFAKDGAFYTSAGITAGIDLSLALIEEDFGNATALRVARELVVYMRRPGGQAQYSEPLRIQMDGDERMGELAAFIDANIGTDLSVDVLAAFAHRSPRHFSRIFRHAFRMSPAAYVQARRLERARDLLGSSRRSVSRLAAMLGYTSDDNFRRAFERRFGVSPMNYRQRFGTGSA